MINFADLNYVDYVVIAIVTLSTLFAFIRGFIGSFLSLAGWILSIYLAYILYPSIQPFLEDKIKNPIIVTVVGHCILLISFLIIFGIINLLISSSIKAFSSGILDRALGAGFGIIRGLMIVSVIFLMGTYTIAVINGEDGNHITDDNILPKWLVDSQTYPLIKEGSQILTSFIPDSFYKQSQQIYEDISKKTVDERFVETALQKIKKSLDPKITNQINEKLEREALTHSSEDLKYIKIKEYLNAYEQNSISGNSTNKSNVSNNDLNRLNKIVKNKLIDSDPAKKFSPVEDSYGVEEVKIDP